MKTPTPEERRRILTEMTAEADYSHDLIPRESFRYRGCAIHVNCKTYELRPEFDTWRVRWKIRLQRARRRWWR